MLTDVLWTYVSKSFDKIVLNAFPTFMLNRNITLLLSEWPELYGVKVIGKKLYGLAQD